MTEQNGEPFSELRSWEPDHDETAHARARARFDAHVARAAGRRPERRVGTRPPSRRLVLALAALVLLVGAGVAIASGFWRTQHTGHLPVFTADGSLNPRFHVGSTGHGYCWTDSAATNARDAFRCFQGNEIHDPCFAATAHASSVVCFLDPWTPVTVLRLTKPLPKHGPLFGRALPWAIETTDGRHCTFLTGATGLMGGQRVNYGCTDRSYLIGGPDERQPLWTIHSAKTYVPDKPGRPTPITRFPVARIARTVP
jgi:hypothetical protein